MTDRTAFSPVLALTRAWATMAEDLPGPERTRADRLRVFLDCRPRVGAFFRSQVDFVEYVDGPHSADVRIQMTTSRSRGQARSYTVTFIGMGPFENIEATARVEDDGRRLSRRTPRVSVSRRLAPATSHRGLDSGQLQILGRS